MGRPAFFFAILLLLSASCANHVATAEEGAGAPPEAFSAPEADPEVGVERELRIVHLEFTTPYDVQQVLLMHFQDPPRVHLDQRRNALVLSAPATVMEQALDVIALLDVPAEQ